MPNKELILMPESSQATIIRRVEAVDLFKFFILFFMVQGHLFRAYLVEPIRLSGWFSLHELLHGIVAPSFLFSAGFAAYLSYHNKKEQYKSFGKAFFTRAKRVLFVIWAGYWIHLPFFSLRKTWKLLAEGQTIEFIRADILQCIGLGSLMFMVIAVLFHKEKIIIGMSALMGLLFFLLPSLTQHIKIWFVIDPYFDHRLSFFPLFPWAGYLFLGIVCAYLYSRMEPEKYFKWLLYLGLAFFPWYFITAEKAYHKAELTFFGNLQKVGGVFLLLWFSYWVVCRYKGRFMEIMKKAASESLFIYIIHLFVIFNTVMGYGIYKLFQNALNVGEALLVLLVVEFVVFAIALAYHTIKKKYPRAWHIGFYLFWVAFLVLFIARKY